MKSEVPVENPYPGGHTLHYHIEGHPDRVGVSSGSGRPVPVPTDWVLIPDHPHNWPATAVPETTPIEVPVATPVRQSQFVAAFIRGEITPAAFRNWLSSTIQTAFVADCRAKLAEFDAGEIPVEQFRRGLTKLSIAASHGR